MLLGWWVKLPGKFPGLELDESVVMPNHIHGIIILTGWEMPSGRRVKDINAKGGHTGPPLQPVVGDDPRVVPGQEAAYLPTIIQWYKTMTTNEYFRGVKNGIWPPFEGKLWQRNYFDHIVRNEKELDAIRAYIHFNPESWQNDRDNPENPNSSAQSFQDYWEDILL